METDQDKHWARVLRTVLGFGKKYGRWPTRLSMPASMLTHIEQLFEPEDYATLRDGVDLVADEDALRAEDEEGRYTYGENLATRLTFTVSEPQPAWLALEPRAPDPDDPYVDVRSALGALGHAGSWDDLPTLIESVLVRSASEATEDMTAGGAPAVPGTASARLFALLRTPGVRNLLTANQFRRVQKVVYHVHAREFLLYFESLARQDLEPWSSRVGHAATLVGLLQKQPLPAEGLRILRDAVMSKTDEDDPVEAEFGELVEGVAGLAMVERLTSQRR